MRRSTILESKAEILEKVVKKSHHNKVYYVDHYFQFVVKMEKLKQIFTIYDGHDSFSIPLIYFSSGKHFKRMKPT